MAKLIDAFPGWATGDGIFSVLEEIYSASTYPWLTHAADMDIEYFGNHSGDKPQSPIVDRFARRSTNGTLSDVYRNTLARLLMTKYTNKWKRLYEVEQAQYEPIENYRMEETETPNLSHKHSVSDDYSESDTRTLKRDIVKTENATNDYNVTDERKVNVDTTVQTNQDNTGSVFGFNSSAAVGANKNEGGSTVHTTGSDTANKETNTHSQTGGMEYRETAADNDNVETDTRRQTGYREDTETGTRNLTRSGNIGVTTSQQMLESEIALWQWTFIEQVFQDVDKLLTCEVYE